jgi:hypothetical protein
MNERLKELAEQAGFQISRINIADMGWVWCSEAYPIDEELERFAELVRQDEREACAKLCDDIAQYDGYIAAACAEEIRARGEK